MLVSLVARVLAATISQFGFEKLQHGLPGTDGGGGIAFWRSTHLESPGGVVRSWLVWQPEAVAGVVIREMPIGKGVPVFAQSGNDPFGHGRRRPSPIVFSRDEQDSAVNSFHTNRRVLDCALVLECVFEKRPMLDLSSAGDFFQERAESF